MRNQILKRLNQAQENNESIVLITSLENGDQKIFKEDKPDFAAALTEEESEFALKALRTDRCQLLDNDNGKVFFQPQNPALRVIIIGAVHIAQALAPLLKQCAYQVIIVDPRQTFATDSRFPGIEVSNDWPDKALDKLRPDWRTAIVTLTHDTKLDDPALEMALHSNAFYIGSLGSKKTHNARLERLKSKGFSQEQCDRIHAPVGLDIGAQSPAEIAISIMAEITQTLRKEQSNAV